MLIDWFTVGAQVVNFLILAGLLRLFLYRRILKAMDQREANIAARLEEAETKFHQAEAEAESYRRKSQEIETERSAVLAAAKAQADARRAELMTEAREEVEQTRRDWAESLEREKTAFLEQLRRRAAGETFEMTRNLLREMADAELEDRMTTLLLQRIRELPPKKHQEIAEALRVYEEPVIVRTAFPIPEPRLREITECLRVLAGDDSDGRELTIDDQVEPELVCGAEIEVSGHKIGWSLDDYLGRVEESLLEMIEEEAHRHERAKRPASS